ncbi:MAG: M81 family metallopeptidase [Alphaproteobacteria bacterium]|nr:M81 family metallopeptidase [Alphaproteobacteria bacterium]
MPPARKPRVAILGMHLESNAFAPVTTAADFHGRCFQQGEAIMKNARAAAPHWPMEAPGFVAEMDRSGAWEPVPILITGAEPGGPAEHRFIQDCLRHMREGLKAALPLDAVYITNHGAMTTTEDPDPDGELYAMVRSVVGAAVPVAATVDLHCNPSERMVASVDVLIGYRTNPHVDMRERGAEAARALREMMGGVKTTSVFIRLPIVAPTVTLLTAAGPYADLIDMGQRLKAPDIMNVTVLGGFAFSDTPKNGLAIIVTARGSNPAPARRLARQIAEAAWTDRQRYSPKLTPLADAVAMAKACGDDPKRPALILPDVADNPGGGGGGNTTWLLKALCDAGVKGALFGVFIDPALAAEAHKLGVGARFDAVFNRAGETDVAKRYVTKARVISLHDGRCVGRRGLYAGASIEMGPCAALDLGGVTVVVGTERNQCADPVFFEMMGLDIAKARSVVVKSRGHFRAGFDEFFPPERVVEVDCPGLTTPMLSRLTFKRLPRPVFPLDADARWVAPA